MAESLASAPASVAPATTPTAAPVADAATTQSQPAKLFKIKVDGQDFELPESEIISLAQQGKSAGKRFQEAAAAKREAEQVVNYLKSNPKEAFKKLGIDVRKFSEDTLLEMIQEEQMSPEQKKSRENERELQKYRDSEKAAKEKEHNDKMAALENEHMQSYDQMFTKVLSESGLPKTAYTVRRMAELTLINVKKGLDLEPAQLAKIVREDYIEEQKALFSNSSGDDLLELLGKEAVKKLSKAQLSKYKAAKVNNSVPQQKVKEMASTNPIDAWKQMQKKTRSMR